jgi:hypothetical protein
MIKNFVIASLVAGAAMISSPALADGRDHRWGVDSNRHSPYYGLHSRTVTHTHIHNHRSRNRDVVNVLAVVGAVAVVNEVVNRNNRHQEVERVVYTTPRALPQNCTTREFYENGYLVERRTTCR